MYKSIAISGQIASGTSTAAKNVAQKLGLKYESAGEFFRKYAKEHSIPLYDKAQIPDELDRGIDKKLTNLAKLGGWSIDAHYIGFFAKDDQKILKVLLTCQADERYKRAASRKANETPEEIQKREVGLDKKFRKLYADENFLDPKFFDLTIDTTNINQEETAQKIEGAFNS